MNKKKLMLFGVLGLFTLVLVTAGVYLYVGSVSVDATVNEALSVSEVPISFGVVYPGETKTENVVVNNLADVSLNVELKWTMTSNNFVLDNSEGDCLPYPSETCEKRIVILVDDIGITTLNNLDTISWDADVTDGYLPHVDVFLDNGETLVFEYAKVDASNCDDTLYPTGKLNTFDGNGIVDSDAYAWLSSGVPGPCGLPAFDNNHKTLTQWKVVYGDVDVTKIEVEVDNWISPSDSNVWDITINDNVIEGVTYTTDMSKTVEVSPLGETLIPVDFTIDSDSSVGEFTGVINVERVA